MASSYCPNCDCNADSRGSDLVMTLAGEVYIITCRNCGAVIGVIKDDSLCQESGA